VPRPAASVVLLRRGGKHKDRALEVLLLKRTEKARFMPGVWVFPGGAVDTADGEGDGEEARRACAVRELAEECGVELPSPEELVLFSRWITPELIPIRFDAWFFLAVSPPHSTPEPDGRETTEAAWYSPSAALAANQAGEIEIAFPTMSQMRTLEPFASADEALDHFRERQIESILPKIVGEGEDIRTLLPDDPDYDNV
jgi:8-oxo-dGTP pyrophosphatase MutT (NUDIX family)